MQSQRKVRPFKSVLVFNLMLEYLFSLHSSCEINARKHTKTASLNIFKECCQGCFVIKYSSHHHLINVCSIQKKVGAVSTPKYYQAPNKRSCCPPLFMLLTPCTTGGGSGVREQRRGERRPQRPQLSVPRDPRPAEGAASLLLQPGVLQEAGGAEEHTPEEHGRAGEDVHQPGRRQAQRRGPWGRRRQTVHQVAYIPSSTCTQGSGSKL